VITALLPEPNTTIHLLSFALNAPHRPSTPKPSTPKPPPQLFDQFTAYMKEIKAAEQEQARFDAVFPCVLQVGRAGAAAALSYRLIQGFGG